MTVAVEDLIGRQYIHENSWRREDCMLYAIAVGCSHQHLAFTTENSDGIEQQVLPSFASVLVTSRELLTRLRAANGGRQALLGNDKIRLHRPIPVEGRATINTTVRDVFDKGKHAVAVTTSTVCEQPSGRPICESETAFVLLDGGGFGGERGPQQRPTDQSMERPVVGRFRVGSQSALLYRLLGGRSPVHADPRVAAKAGFPAPVLQGRCLLGHAVRWILDELLDGDACRISGLHATFRRPAFPGDVVEVDAQANTDEITFVVRRSDGTPLLDGGCVHLSQGRIEGEAS